MHPQKHLLGELLGLGAIAEHAKRHPEDAMLVGDHQVLERSRVAAPEPVHQGGIIAGPPFHPVRPYRPSGVPICSNSTDRAAHAFQRRTPRPILPTMLREEQVRELADHWVKAWNSHDLDRIMAHYDDDVVLVSPVAVKVTGDPSGRVSGKAALRSYFERALGLYPNLRFDLLDVMWGLQS